MPAVNAGVNIARRCGRISSTPPSAPSTVWAQRVAARDRRVRARPAEDLPALQRQVGPVPGDRPADAHMLWSASFVGQRGTDSARDIVGRGVEHYVELVDQHRTFGALPAAGQIRRPVTAATATVNRAATSRSPSPRDQQRLEEMERDPASFELAAFAIFGTAASATDWWLGADNDSRAGWRRTSRRHLTTITMGATYAPASCSA